MPSRGWLRIGDDKDLGQIILVRSATTEFDDQKRIVGTLDIPLSVRGQAELSGWANELKDRQVEVIYAAAGAASRDTAKFLGDALDVKVKVLEDLTNLDFGLWQGLEESEVRRKHPRLYRHWEESPVAICPPNGETVEEVRERVHKELKPVLKKAHHGVVVLVAPDPLRQIVRCYLKNADLTKLWDCPQGSAWETIDVQ
jgi:probable phosphoglycerate mutase